MTLKRYFVSRLSSYRHVKTFAFTNTFGMTNVTNRFYKRNYQHYFDYAASTPTVSVVKDAIMNYLNNENAFGNPSSTHSIGETEKKKIEDARKYISGYFEGDDVIFTSGATEANNLSLLGLGKVKKMKKKRQVIFMGAGEHSSVLKQQEALTQMGYLVIPIELDFPSGQINFKYFEHMLAKHTDDKHEVVAISHMLVSNQFGTLFDIKRLSEIVKRVVGDTCLLHIDATQGVSKVSKDLLSIKRYSDLPVMMCFSGHKMGCIKGIGGIVMNASAKAIFKSPLIHGGSQEYAIRPGTENVLAIVALHALMKAELTEDKVNANIENYKSFYQTLKEELNDSDIEVVESDAHVYHIVTLYVPVAPGEVYFNHLNQEGFAVSLGSACQAGSKAIPEAFKAREYTPDMARSFIRVSFFNGFTTVEGVKQLAATLKKLADKFISEQPNYKKGRRLEKWIARHAEKREKHLFDESKKPTPKNDAVENMVKNDFTYSRVLIRWGELGLKGKNRKNFILTLQRNVSKQLKTTAKVRVEQTNDRLFVVPVNDEECKKIPEIINRLQEVFGIASVSPCVKCDWEIASIEEACRFVASKEIQTIRGTDDTKKLRFRISAKRQKGIPETKFAYHTQELQRHVGGVILRSFKNLEVDLHEYEVEVGVDVRKDAIYAFGEKFIGIRGLPTGTSGKALCLLSGGFDSPVASYMMMKRGCTVHYISFWSYPYIGEKLVHKIKRLVKQLSRYQGLDAKLYLVPFAKIQETIRDTCEDRYRTILYRRAMNYVANNIAYRNNMKVLVTGEALGQVASQTMDNLSCINESARRPMLRPLIGMDKIEILKISEKIGTHDLSVERAPDCCTLFQPSKPITNARLEDVLAEEKKIENMNHLVYIAMKYAQVMKITPETKLEDIETELRTGAEQLSNNVESKDTQAPGSIAPIKN